MILLYTDLLGLAFGIIALMPAIGGFLVGVGTVHVYNHVRE